MAVATYYQSISFGSLGPATKQVSRRILDNFRDEWGENRLATLRAAARLKMVSRIRSAPACGKTFPQRLARDDVRCDRGRLATG